MQMRHERQIVQMKCIPGSCQMLRVCGIQGEVEYIWAVAGTLCLPSWNAAGLADAPRGLRAGGRTMEGDGKGGLVENWLTGACLPLLRRPLVS